MITVQNYTFVAKLKNKYIYIWHKLINIHINARF